MICLKCEDFRSVGRFGHGDTVLGRRNVDKLEQEGIYDLIQVIELTVPATDSLLIS